MTSRRRPAHSVWDAPLQHPARLAQDAAIALLDVFPRQVGNQREDVGRQAAQCDPESRRRAEVGNDMGAQAGVIGGNGHALNTDNLGIHVDSSWSLQIRTKYVDVRHITAMMSPVARSSHPATDLRDHQRHECQRYGVGHHRLALGTRGWSRAHDV
jgi:hypothetical protein